MFFNSWGYILFLIVAVILYWSCPHKYRIYLISVLSIIFYSMWRWEYSFLMLFSASLDWFASRKIYQAKDNTSQ